MYLHKSKNDINIKQFYAMLIIWPVYQIITFNSLPVYQIQLYVACKCLLCHWHVDSYNNNYDF